MVVAAHQMGSAAFGIPIAASLQRKSAENLVFPTTRKISRLLETVAILDCNVMQHAATRGEACHWILGRFAPCESSSLATARNDGGVGSVINPEYRVHAGDSIV